MITAVADLNTGVVVFYDATGKQLLAEKNTATKLCVPFPWEIPLQKILPYNFSLMKNSVNMIILMLL